MSSKNSYKTNVKELQISQKVIHTTTNLKIEDNR